MKNWSPYAITYDPLKAGSIDGTDTEPHDKAITRAINARYDPPRDLKSDPSRTLFVGRIGTDISKNDLTEVYIAYYSLKVYLVYYNYII